jgi:ketosteroid isomerase-like protein
MATMLAGMHHGFSQTPAADASGKWVGALDIVHADGSVVPDQAFFSLAVKDGAISGTAGNSADHQSPLTSGKAAGNRVTLEIAAGPDRLVQFDLLLDSDHMRGRATGLPAEEGSRIIVDVRRANASWGGAPAVAHIPDRLFETVAALDEKLFTAYNHCDLATMSSLVADDLEFYHDKTGLSTGKKVFLDAIRDNICGKTQRELISGSMEVHRLDHYGAVEIGRHRFVHPGHEEIGVGEAKFITVWRFQDGTWQMTRAISYDHGAAPAASAANGH